MNKEGTFMWAVEQMKEGKKVKRPNSNYKYLSAERDGSLVSTDDGKLFGMWFNDIGATDWEIVKDDKTVSDKIETNPFLGGCIRVKDVKEANQTLVNCLNILIDSKTITKENVKETMLKIFGKELI